MDIMVTHHLALRLERRQAATRPGPRDHRKHLWRRCRVVPAGDTSVSSHSSSRAADSR